MKPIYHWRYTLRSATALNARGDRREHEGALVRVGSGHGCLHPWPELGDAPLDDQLAALASGNGNATPIAAAAMRCAELDGAAREAGASLFQEPIPESHWLVLPGDDPLEARERGFRIAKIKGSPDTEALRERLEEWTGAGLRVRLDCNESFAPGAFAAFWKGLGDGPRKAVEFVEDPEEWTDEGWRELREGGVPVAADRDAKLRWRPGDVHVLKPARFEGWPDREARFTVTSYMDHALGQAYAAHFASTVVGRDRLLPCGLLTQRCFEADPFFERVRTDGPRLLPVEGTGLGFDDLLENLPWKRLT